MNLGATRLIARLHAHAAQTPEQPATASSACVLTYGQLAARVSAQSQKLAELGVAPESVVGIACADQVQHLVLCLAVAQLGAASCTLPCDESSEQRVQMMAAYGVTIVIGAEEAINSSVTSGPTAPPHGPTESDAVILFSTSGTTGAPKVVELRDADLVTQAPRHVLSPDERFACIASIEHNFAKRHRLYCVAQGACNVFLGDHRRYLADELRTLNVSVLHVSAFQAQELLALSGRQAPQPIRLKLGGSHVPQTLRNAIRQRLTTDLRIGYGTTETGAIAFTDPADPIDNHKGETVGRALPGITIRIVDSDRRAVPIGERGEIAIHGAGLFRGYRGQPSLTAERLVDGWFHTGDLGSLDADGRLSVSGRADDMFVFNSMNIYPQELESTLREHPNLADAAVLAKLSPTHGAIPVALVVWSAGGSDLPALKRFARAQFGVRCPRQFIAVEQIPRNPTGKVDRQRAQALLG